LRCQLDGHLQKIHKLKMVLQGTVALKTTEPLPA
jgi:hypothetical protein